MSFPGSEELIQSAEASLGRRLPDAYRQRLLADNGGEGEALGDRWRLYPVWDPTDRRTVARTTNHIIRENEALRSEWPEALPAGWIAVADDGGGDLLVLPAGEDRVRIWDHETGQTEPVEVSWNVDDSRDKLLSRQAPKDGA
jgi:hypothetical protein